MFALEIYPPALQVQGGGEKAACLYHSALCKQIPFHMGGESTERQLDATLPCSEEWKGKETKVFHLRVHIRLCLSCTSWITYSQLWQNICLQTPEVEYTALCSLGVWTPVWVSKEREFLSCPLQKRRLPLCWTWAPGTTALWCLDIPSSQLSTWLHTR